MFFKIGVLEYFAIFTGKHLCWSLFLITLLKRDSSNFIKKGLQHRRFPVNIAKFLRTAFFIEQLRCFYIILRVVHNNNESYNSHLLQSSSFSIHLRRWRF